MGACQACCANREKVVGKKKGKKGKRKVKKTIAKVDHIDQVPSEQSYDVTSAETYEQVNYEPKKMVIDHINNQKNKQIDSIQEDIEGESDEDDAISLNSALDSVKRINTH